MSCTIRRYASQDLGPGHETLHVTAFIGNPHKRRGLQFTIGNHYCALTPNQAEDLVKVIKRRLACVDGYTATGNERDDIDYQEA